MLAPLYRRIDGHVLLAGSAPDGDSIRFLPRDASALGELRRARLLRTSPVNGSVQLRLEGIDAPELHYVSEAQPRGALARDALLAWLGVGRVTYAADGVTIAHADPAGVPVTILADAVDPNGRVIAYLQRADTMLGASRKSAALPKRKRVDAEALAATANVALLAAGHVYLLMYTSLPLLHRHVLRDVARGARAKKLGVHSADATERGFAVRGERALSPTGALIFPKLFRRVVDFRRALVQGFHGSFGAWLAGHGSHGAPSPDRVNVKHAANILFASLVKERAGRVSLTTDPTNLIFVEA